MMFKDLRPNGVELHFNTLDELLKHSLFTDTKNELPGKFIRFSKSNDLLVVEFEDPHQDEHKSANGVLWKAIGVLSNPKDVDLPLLTAHEDIHTANFEKNRVAEILK